MKIQISSDKKPSRLCAPIHPRLGSLLAPGLGGRCPGLGTFAHNALFSVGSWCWHCQLSCLSQSGKRLSSFPFSDLRALFVLQSPGFRSPPRPHPHSSPALQPQPLVWSHPAPALQPHPQAPPAPCHEHAGQQPTRVCSGCTQPPPLYLKFLCTVIAILLPRLHELLAWTIGKPARLPC